MLPRLLTALPLCLLLGASPCKGRKTEIKVTLLSAIPEQLILEQLTPRGWGAIDSAWPASNGRYYLKINESHPGLYQLRLANLGALPLLISKPEKPISINMRGEDFTARSTIDDASASVYLRALHLQDQANYWRFLASQAKKIVDAAPHDLDLMDSLAMAAVNKLNRYVDSSTRNTSDSILHHFLFLARRPASTTIHSWWPSTLLLDSTIAHSDALREHLQNYFYAQLSDGFSRTQLDSAFATSLRALASSRMHPDVAQRLRAYILLFFTEAHYLNCARLAALSPFGPLAPIPHLAPPPTNELPASEALHVNVRNLAGRDIPLINPNTRYTLAVFWSVWCPHCQLLLPRIYPWWESLPPGLLDVLTISIDRPGEALSAHINLKQWKWRNAVEERNEESSLLEKVGFDGTPYLVLYDRHGTTVAIPQTLSQLKNQRFEGETLHFKR